MRTADMVKSKYFRAVDVQGQRPLILTIADVTEELMGRGGGRQDVKCFLWFTETLKGLQLNKSRVAILEAAYGPDSVLWTGKRVRLSFDPTVIFGGRAVGGIKLETPAGVVYTPSNEAHAGWGDAPVNAPGRPPAPVWDEQRGQWIVREPPAAPANRPPPPVWNEAAGRWEFVNPTTGEIAAPVETPGQMPAGRGLSELNKTTTDDFDDQIPF
jgi:hypothetical protein